MFLLYRVIQRLREEKFYEIAEKVANLLSIHLYFVYARCFFAGKGANERLQFSIQQSFAAMVTVRGRDKIRHLFAIW